MDTIEKLKEELKQMESALIDVNKQVETLTIQKYRLEGIVLFLRGKIEEEIPKESKPNESG